MGDLVDERYVAIKQHTTVGNYFLPDGSRHPIVEFDSITGFCFGVDGQDPKEVRGELHTDESIIALEYWEEATPS